MGKKIKADDLTTVEGIGPKIAELFHNNNIKTWHSLSTSSIEERRNVLNSGGKRFEIHNPESWALQAGMAFDGKWKELAKWQDEHKGGRM
ncbi:LSU ribosomal protein L21p [Nonlabens ulvanivorans]|nr:helix-hairpin-helix domain-containing protein [Nonlabens ulvanivorans]GAL74177.1 LSU ribosomal protein L21p [Nonlabens ulvanivorans]